MNSFKRFNEKKLPDKECFYRSKDGTAYDDGQKLDGHINGKECLTCKNLENLVWKIWKKDVLLLADVFKKFIGTCLKFYVLDSCQLFSSPGLSWDAMLKMTGVKLEKILDIDMHLFIEKGMRGGISYIAKRYAKANNKYMINYYPKNPSKFITYVDMNILYGWAMSGYLPYGGFKWLKKCC